MLRLDQSILYRDMWRKESWCHDFLQRVHDFLQRVRCRKHVRCRNASLTNITRAHILQNSDSKHFIIYIDLPRHFLSIPLICHILLRALTASPLTSNTNYSSKNMTPENIMLLLFYTTECCDFFSVAMYKQLQKMLMS